MAINTKSLRARHGVAVGDDTTVKEVVDSLGKWIGVDIESTHGGSGVSTYAQGDLLYAGTANPTALSKLTIGAASKVLRSTGTAPAWSTSTFPDSASATAGSFLRSDGTNFVNSTLILPNAATQYNLLYASTANNIAGLATGNNGVLVTNGSGVPSISTTLPAHTVTTSVTVPTIYSQSATGGTLTLRANSTDLTGTVAITSTTASTTVDSGALTVDGGVGINGAVFMGSTLSVTGNVTLSGTGNSVGTITAGTWSGTIIGLTKGGTAASLTASNGGIVYSTATALAVLAGTATSNQILVSGASTTPAWSTATYPTSVTGAGKIIRASGANVFTTSTATYPDTATGTGTILRADGTNWVASTATYLGTTTANRLLFSSATNTVSESSADLTWNDSTKVFNFGATTLVKINSAATVANTVLGVNTGNTGLEYKNMLSGEGVEVVASAGAYVFNLTGAVTGDTYPNANTFGTYKVGQNVLIGAANTSVSKTVTTASWLSNVITFSSAGHGLIQGQKIIVAGVTPTGYNGAYTILSSATDSFTVSNGSNPGTYSSGGSIYYTLSSIDATNALEVRAGAGTSLTNLISAYSSNDQSALVFNVAAAGDVTATGKITTTKTDATTNSPVSVAKLGYYSSGTPSVGIGAQIELETETANGNYEVGTVLESVTTNVGSGTEAFEFRIKNMNAGAGASVNLIANPAGIYGSNQASYNMILSPTTNATNGVLTIKDAHTNISSFVTSVLSGTFTNTIVEAIDKTTVRSIKYIIQASQGSAYDCREILVIHDGTTAVWNDYGKLQIGAFTDYSYDVNVGTTNVELRISGSALPNTTLKVQRIVVTQ